jgi:hypothetical protein
MFASLHERVARWPSRSGWWIWLVVALALGFLAWLAYAPRPVVSIVLLGVAFACAVNGFVVPAESSKARLMKLIFGFAFLTIAAFVAFLLGLSLLAPDS